MSSIKNINNNENISKFSIIKINSEEENELIKAKKKAEVLEKIRNDKNLKLSIHLEKIKNKIKNNEEKLYKELIKNEEDRLKNKIIECSKLKIKNNKPKNKNNNN